MEETTLPASDREILARVYQLGSPVLVEQALLYLVGVSDTILTGRYLGENDLAAVTVSSYLFWFLETLLVIVSIGATALVARMFGANERDDAIVVCEQSIGLAIVVGTLIAIAGWLATPLMVDWLNLEGEANVSAVMFLRIFVLATPFLSCTIVGIAALQGAGDTRTGMWLMIFFNVLNIALTWSLVQGFGPFPPLGLRGIAIGTSISETTAGLIVLGLLIRGCSGLKIRLRGWRPSKEVIQRVLRISIPAAGESLATIVGQLWFLSLINKLGPVATAAHGVAIRCEAISFLSVAAFSVPASTLTGQYLGAKRPDLAARAAKLCWLCGVLSMSALGILLIVAAEPMFSVFLGDRQPKVMEVGVPVLRVVAFAMPALATIVILSGSLRGAGDTRWPSLIVFFGFIAVRIPLTYWLTDSPSTGGLGWGLYGAWIAMLVDLVVRGGLILARFLQGGWRFVKV